MQVATINNALLQIIEAPNPIPQKNEVIIKVAAAGLNRADIFQRQGLYLPPKNITNIPGLEVSGEIIALGDNVSGDYIGKKVCVLLEGGGYAVQVAVPFSHCLPIPSSVTLEQAAALPEVCATVWYNVFMKAKLKKGERLLVHGGSSGVGSMALQIAHALGIECYATAGSDEKCRWAETIGATKVFNYRREDFVEGVLALTKGKGVDVLLDMVGGDYVQKNLKMLARNGRLVSIAFLHGSKIEANMASLVFKNICWMGSTLRDQPRSIKKKILAEVQKHIWPLIEQGQVKPLIDCIFAFDQVVEAHSYMEKGRHKGKILLRL